MRRLPPLASLRAFEAAARHLSFQHAAEELRVTPTAISHQIRLLEDYCGQALFRRRPRPIALTEAGRHLYPVLRDGFDGFAATLETLSDATPDRALRVTTPRAFASRWLVPRLPAWRRAHPDIRLEVIGENATIDLYGGEADVAIRYMPEAPEGLDAVQILSDGFWPMCHPSLLDPEQPVRSAADLLHYPLIEFDWFIPETQLPCWSTWLAAVRKTDATVPAAPPEGYLYFREEEHAIDAVLAGQGIAILSDVVVEADLRAGRLLKAHDFGLPGRRYFVCHPPGGPRLEAAKTFAAWVASCR